MNKYFEKKAKYAHYLYDHGLPFKKVYAVVEKDDKFIVLKNQNDKSKFLYSLAGGGIDEGETTEQAIKREVLEELNANIEFIKSLGFLTYKVDWTYNNRTVPVDYFVEVVYTKFISFIKNKNLGLEGEFNKNVSIAEISKKDLLENVSEFKDGKIKLN